MPPSLLARVAAASAVALSGAPAQKSALEIEAGLRDVGDIMGNPRRLFDFPGLNLGGMVENLNVATHNFVAEQSEALGIDPDLATGIGDSIGANWESQASHNLGVDKAVDALNQASGMVSEGVTASNTGWSSVQSLSGEMKNIHRDFEPIQPVFESNTGVLQLLTSRSNMGTLCGVVQRLLNTSTVLETLSGALQGIGNIFNKLMGFFRSVLANIGGGEAAERRRLQGFDYMQLLQGLDFDSITANMGWFVQQVQQYAASFGKADAVLSPVLATLGGALGARRLAMAADQAKYKEAIGTLVPTWQKLENSTISMCPTTLSAVQNAKSLMCRIADFVKNQGLDSQVPGIVAACDANPDQEAGVLAQTQCPTKSYSAGIQDKMFTGQGGDVIAYLLAAVASLGVVGGAGVMGMKMCRKKDQELLGSESEEA